jgi:hypothetical protein
MRTKYIVEFNSNGAKVKIEFLTIEQRDQFVIDATIINPIISEIEDEILTENEG